VGQRHQLWGLVSGVPEHDSLVTSADVLWGLLLAMHAVGDLSRLCVELVDDLTGLVVETLVWVVETDSLDGVANNLLVIDNSLGSDLTKDHHEAGTRAGLACDVGVWVLCEASIDDCV